MRLTEKSSGILMMTDYLRNAAICEIKNLCIAHNGRLNLSGSVSIDIDAGYGGVRNCNIHAVVYEPSADSLQLRVGCIDSGETFETDLLHHHAIEVLEIIGDAQFVPESDFLTRFPEPQLVTEEKDVLEMWELFDEVPVNNDDEIETDFLYWPKGTDKYEIWRWFDRHYSKGVAAMLY